MKLPDFEAWAVFAKVAETGAFALAAKDLGLSNATVSKAVSRLEQRLGATLFHRTSRRLSLTDSGRASLEAASRLLADGEALELEISAQSAAPRGLVRMAAPMSFGIAHLGDALADFFALYPDVSVELSLSDELIDIVEDGFDLALRISALEDSSLLARRLCPVRVMLVGAPAYFERHGVPQHPKDLASHRALFYTGARSRDAWRFEHAQHGQYAISVPAPLRANNADVFRALLLQGQAIAMQPDFLVWNDMAEGRLMQVLADWAPPPIAMHLVTPPSTIRPARVKVLMEFLAERLAKAPWRG